MNTKSSWIIILLLLTLFGIVIGIAVWQTWQQLMVTPTPVPTPTVVVTQTPISAPAMGMDAIQNEVVANATMGAPENCSSASAIMAPAGCPFAPPFPPPVSGNP